MPKMKLTKTNIDRVRKPGTGTVIYVDTETKGFGLRVTASGAASFIVQGTIAGQAKEARITIGSYGAWTVDDARRRAEQYKHQFEDGIDPRDVKKQDEASRFGFRCRRRLWGCSSPARASSWRTAPKVPSSSQAGDEQAGLWMRVDRWRA